MDLSENMTEEPSTQSPKPTTSFKLSPLQSSSPPSPLPLPQPLPIITTTTTIPLKQPHHILFDIWGVITSHTFRTDLYQYLEREDVLESFLQASFHTPEVERFLQAFVLKNIADRGEKGGYHQLPIIGLADCCDDKRSKVASLAKNLRLRLQLRKQDPSLVDGNIEALFNLVWMEGSVFFISIKSSVSKIHHPHLFLSAATKANAFERTPFPTFWSPFESGPLQILLLQIFVLFSCTASPRVRRRISASFWPPQRPATWPPT